MRFVPALLVAVGVTLLSSGCSTMPVGLQPEMQAVHPRITAIDFGGANMTFDIDINNPLPVPLMSPSLSYGIEIQGIDFITAEMPVGAEIPARAAGTLAFPVRISYSDVSRIYPGFSSESQFAYKLRGVVVLSALGQFFEVPVSHAGTIPILRPPTFTAVKVRLADVSLSKARIIVDSEIKNPNVFPLGVKNLRYTLDMGDIQVGDLGTSSTSSVGPRQTRRLDLAGDISASEGLIKLLMSGVSGKPEVIASGSIQTPYGPVRLQR